MTLSKEKFEHIMAYAKQQQKLGVHHCNILPDDMVAIMEMATGKLERRERDGQVPVAGTDGCDREVFEKGKSACLVAISKDDAETICRGVSAATGCKVDWHYVGGRVHIKALYASPPAPVVPDECVDKQAICWMRSHSLAGNYRDGWNDCRAAMLTETISNTADIAIDEGSQSFGNSEQLNSPVAPDGWISVGVQMPDPKSEQRVCVFTPTPHEDMRYRFVPASLFKAVCSSATHWYYMEPPAAPKQESE